MCTSHVGRRQNRCGPCLEEYACRKALGHLYIERKMRLFSFLLPLSHQQKEAHMLSPGASPPDRKRWQGLPPTRARTLQNARCEVYGTIRQGATQYIPFLFLPREGIHVYAATEREISPNNDVRGQKRGRWQWDAVRYT